MRLRTCLKKFKVAILSYFKANNRDGEFFPNQVLADVKFQKPSANFAFSVVKIFDRFPKCGTPQKVSQPTINLVSSVFGQWKKNKN